MLLEQFVSGEVAAGRAKVENQYARVVRTEGNKAALDLMARTFSLRETFEWRGLGWIERSGFGISPEYGAWDAERKFTVPGVRVADPQACECGSVLTGRLSSNDPNLQNIPVRTEDGRKIRTAFVAAPGKVLVSADYSQIELRILAHIADIQALKDAFEEGLDIHAMTASEMFGVPVAGMPSEVRRRAKAINFGIIYGISAFGLANQLGIERSEAGEYIKTYFARFPGIQDYMAEQRRKVKADGYVMTIFGRKIAFPNANSSHPAERSFVERASINAPIQGSAADIIRRAMIRMEPALARARIAADMLLQVHDELIFEVDQGTEADAMPVIAAVMENAAMPAVNLSVPLKVDAHAAHNWDEAH